MAEMGRAKVHRISRRDSLRGGAALAAGFGLGALAGRRPAEAQTDSARDADRIDCDVCVIGGGSGGIGAGIAAARQGANTVLIERNQMLGGTSTVAWIHSWEPSVGGGGLPREMFERMRPDKLGCVQVEYRHGEPRRKQGNWLAFEPYRLAQVAAEMLAEAGCSVLSGATFYAAKRVGGAVREAHVLGPTGALRVRARVFIDCTADVVVARDVGCPTRLGTDAASEFEEPHAPEKHDPTLNAMTLCYRVRETDSPQPLLPGEDISGADKWGAAERPLPCGDRYINVVGMLPGVWGVEKTRGEVLREGYRRVAAHFRARQRDGRWKNWQLVGIAPEVGIRETWRIVAEHTLTEHDLQAGLIGQQHDDMIAVADHAVDVHGSGHAHYELPHGAYGVPYRCLIPQGMENLLVACRGAGFSHIAASSCRLSRTMIALGQAAGTAAALAAKGQLAVGEVNVAQVRELLRSGGVELTPEDLTEIHPDYYNR